MTRDEAIAQSLLALLPMFDVGWPQEQQNAWLRAYQTIMQRWQQVIEAESKRKDHP